MECYVLLCCIPIIVPAYISSVVKSIWNSDIYLKLKLNDISKKDVNTELFI